MQNDYFQKSAGFLYTVQTLLPPLLTLQASANAIGRFTSIKEAGEMLKNVSHGKMLEIEFMVHDKCNREYTRLPKDETVR